MALGQEIQRRTRNFGRSLALCVRTFVRVEGPQRAAAFSYYAFLALFPMAILMATIASGFVSQASATSGVVYSLEKILPLGSQYRGLIFYNLWKVAEKRQSTGVLAFLGMLYVSLLFLNSLVRAINSAWRTKADSWWHGPAKNLGMLFIVASCFLLGMLAPIVAREARPWLPSLGLAPRLVALAMDLLFPLLVFYGIGMLYILAPHRPPRFSQVWLPALLATLALRLSDTVFLWYAAHLSDFAVLYGVLGGTIAVLIWLYVAGCIFILGGCLCAAQAQVQDQWPARGAAASVRQGAPDGV